MYIIVFYCILLVWDLYNNSSGIQSYSKDHARIADNASTVAEIKKATLPVLEWIATQSLWGEQILDTVMNNAHNSRQGNQFNNEYEGLPGFGISTTYQSRQGNRLNNEYEGLPGFGISTTYKSRTYQSRQGNRFNNEYEGNHGLGVSTISF
ncbi:MAG TPA: hypothetical protein QF353_01025 [Gammaproteobacteria bacterium]|nr:hypothetical protein [Gammaproteobacteria bacterium]